MIPPEATGTASPKKPFFRKPLLVLLSLGAAIPGFYAFENWRGNRAWEEHCRLLREQGHPIQLIPRAPARLPREVKPKLEQDFQAVDGVFSKAERLVNKGNPPGTSGRGEDLIVWAQALNWVQSGQKEEAFLLTSKETNVVARVRAAEAILEAFSAFDALSDEVRLACRRPDLTYPFGYDESRFGRVNRIFSAISFCRRLRLKTSAQLTSGRTSDALRELDLILCLADSLRSDPLLISGIGNLSCRSIALPPFREALVEHRYGESDLRQLQSMLRSESLVEEVPRIFRRERDATLSLYEADLFGVRQVSGCECLLDEAYDLAFRLMPSGWRQWEKLRYSLAIEHIVTSGYIESEKRILPSTVLHAESGVRITGGLKSQFSPWFLLATCLPRMSDFALNSTATQVTTDHLQIGCGLELYCLKHGEYPQELVQLAPDFISTLPQDPIAGKSYGYARTLEGGYKLWSVGWNETDEGGVSGGSTFRETVGDWVTQAGPRMHAVRGSGL